MSENNWPYSPVRQAPAEGQARNATLPDSATTTLISDVSSGHATRIEVLIASDVIVTPSLVIYGANGGVAAVVALAAVVAGTDYAAVHTDACGQYYDVRLANASGGAGDVTVWTGAKS